MLCFSSIREFGGSREEKHSHVFELSEEVKVLLKDQTTFHGNPDAPLLVRRLVYLEDNELSITPQGPESNILTAREKLNAFIEKISF